MEEELLVAAECITLDVFKVRDAVGHLLDVAILVEKLFSGFGDRSPLLVFVELLVELVSVYLCCVHEYGARKEVSSGELLKITTHPRFIKYALWLVTDQTAPACGQISPVIGQ